MRKFSIYLDGTEYTLNGEAGIWFTNPEGLGVTFNFPMLDLRNGFFRTAVEDVIPQVPITGTLTFMRTLVTPEDNYGIFKGLLLAANVVEFAYTPDTTLTPVQYRIRVALDYLTKSEKNGNWLSCPVSFSPLTPWYRITTAVVPLAVTLDDANVFKCEYTPYGDLGAAFVLEANGGTPQSVFAFNEAQTEVYGSFSIAASDVINTNGNYVLSTRYEDCYATHTAGGTTVDLVNIAMVNNANEIFPRLRPRKKGIILVGYASDTSKPTSIQATFYNYYRSV